jgi:hypothetical protein
MACMQDSRGTVLHAGGLTCGTPVALDEQCACAGHGTTRAGQHLCNTRHTLTVGNTSRLCWGMNLQVQQDSAACKHTSLRHEQAVALLEALQQQHRYLIRCTIPYFVPSRKASALQAATLLATRHADKCTGTCARANLTHIVNTSKPAW